MQTCGSIMEELWKNNASLLLSKLYQLTLVLVENKLNECVIALLLNLQLDRRIPIFKILIILNLRLIILNDVISIIRPR